MRTISRRHLLNLITKGAVGLAALSVAPRIGVSDYAHNRASVGERVPVTYRYHDSYGPWITVHSVTNNGVESLNNPAKRQHYIDKKRAAGFEVL